MSARDDILDGAVRELREASNPRADERTRILSAVQGFGSKASPLAGAPAAPPGAAPMLALGLRWMAARRASLAWGLALGLATFGAGFGLGRGSVVVPALELAAVPAAPSAAPVLPLAAPALPSRSPSLEPAPSPRPVLEPAPSPRAMQPFPKASARSKAASRGRTPHLRPSPALVEPAPSPLTLAEALQLLHRAERAIYSDEAAWAISLLDELDERAPASMLHEERIATRVLALCADDQVERAERLARQARRAAPDSIYGELLERACNTEESATSSGALPSPHSTRP